MSDLAQALYDLVLYILNPLFEVLTEFGFEYTTDVILGYSYYDLIVFIAVSFVWIIFVYAIYKFFNFIFVVLIKGISV